MDPNETLRKIREAARDVRLALDSYANDTDPLTRAFALAASSDSLADATEALDEWLSKGGFLPSAWQRS